MQVVDYYISKVTITEVDELLEISKNTFVTYFKDYNSEDNLNQYVQNAFTIDKISSELKNPNSEFYFAKYKDENVGYLKINFASAQTELQDKNSLEIERIYVIENFIGKKVGQVLFEKALEIAKNANLKYIWLGVWEQNFRAIRFYEKQNFVKFDSHVFMMGNDEQTDYLMKLML